MAERERRFRRRESERRGGDRRWRAEERERTSEMAGAAAAGRSPEKPPLEGYFGNLEFHRFNCWKEEDKRYWLVEF